MRSKQLIAALLIGGASPSTASAYTECKSGVEKLYSGDDAHFWIFFKNGGSGYLAPNDPDPKQRQSLR